MAKVKHVHANNPHGITHIAPNEAQGIAGSPDFSSEHVASGFHWGIRQLADPGVYNVPGAGSNTVLDGSPGWGDGFKKP